ATPGSAGRSTSSRTAASCARAARSSPPPRTAPRAPPARGAGASRSSRSLSVVVSGKPAQHGAEERVTPGGLRERARIRQQRRDTGFAARRVVAVDRVAEGIEGEVLGESHADRQLS